MSPTTGAIESALAQGGFEQGAHGGAFPSDLSVGVTFRRDAEYRTTGGHAYLRDQGSPTLDTIERLLCELEGGQEAQLYSSGLAASAAAFSALAPGARVVVPDVMYFGLTRWLREFAAPAGIECVEVPTGDIAALEAACAAAPTAMVWVESPANPTWVVTDIAAAAVVAHRHGALLGVDNTVATPVHTNPITLGADVVMHSATKYLNGHDDVVAGVLVTADATTDVWRRARAHRQLAGTVPGTFEAYLLLRGLRTLHVRMARTSRTAQQLAEHLEGHPLVARVAYPGLVGDPGHAVAARQMTGGFSGMMSIFVVGGHDAALAAACSTKLFLRATSLGGTASLIEHRFTFEGPGSRSPQEMLRLSIGLEHVDDLVDDLERALDVAHG